MNKRRKTHLRMANLKPRGLRWVFAELDRQMKEALEFVSNYTPMYYKDHPLNKKHGN